jgi:hypothetical protein
LLKTKGRLGSFGPFCCFLLTTFPRSVALGDAAEHGFAGFTGNRGRHRTDRTPNLGSFFQNIVENKGMIGFVWSVLIR